MKGIYVLFRGVLVAFLSVLLVLAYYLPALSKEEIPCHKQR